MYQDNETACAYDVFGPFIPLFIPWVDGWVLGRFRYPKGMLDTLKSVLRPNVPYITVSQNDEGLTGKNEFDMSRFPNVLVLSAGGYGHVPIPLFKQSEKLNNQKSIGDRSNFVSFVGSLGHAPGGMRKDTHNHLSSLNGSNNGVGGTTAFYKYYEGNQWRTIMAGK